MATGKKGLTITKPGVLLCEGQDEVVFFEAWFSELGIADVQVVPYDGKTQLAQFLADLTKIPGQSAVKQMAIIRDADDNAQGAIESVHGAIAAAPEAIRALSPTSFILPDNASPGALESLWLSSMAGHPMATCVEEFFRCIEGKGWKPSLSHSKNDKARAQLWIATKDIPNARFGHVAARGRKSTDGSSTKEKWIDFEHAAFQPLRDFLLAHFKR